MNKWDRLIPWVIVAGILSSALVSWFFRSTALATVTGVFIGVTLIRASSQKTAIGTGAAVGAVVGLISEGVVYSPARGVGRIIIATLYGLAIGAMWGHFVFLISEAFRRSRSGHGLK